MKAFEFNYYYSVWICVFIQVRCGSSFKNKVQWKSQIRHLHLYLGIYQILNAEHLIFLAVVCLS